MSRECVVCGRTLRSGRKYCWEHRSNGLAILDKEERDKFEEPKTEPLNYPIQRFTEDFKCNITSKDFKRLNSPISLNYDKSKTLKKIGGFLLKGFILYIIICIGAMILGL